MNRIEQAFKDSREHGGSPLLLPFVCAGHPTVDALTTLLPALDRAGASVVEIGFPYSDPIADGPTIAAAMHGALEGGITPGLIFEQVSKVRESVGAGLVAMVSVSIVGAMGGPDAFCDRAKDAGFDGCIFPDIAFEESQPYIDACAKRGLSLALLIAPSTPNERALAISKASRGFTYLLARSGVTGASADIPDISGRVATLRSGSPTPIACGFGISTADQVAEVVKHADGAIVGSALVKVIDEAHKRGGSVEKAAEDFVAELAVGLVSMDNL